MRTAWSTDAAARARFVVGRCVFGVASFDLVVSRAAETTTTTNFFVLDDDLI